MKRYRSATVAHVFLLFCLSGPGLGGLVPAAAVGQPEDDRERQVMERFLAVLKRAPRRGTALDRVYGYHVERGTLDGLIKTYEERTARDPSDGAGWLLLGLFEAQRGRDAAAVAALRRAEQERKDDALPAYYLAQALVMIGQPDAAVLALERAIDRHPARTDLLEIFQALGRIHQRAHRNNEALAVWTRLEQLFPDDARVQERIASALAEESQLEPALVRYEALAKTSRDPYRRVLFRLEAVDLKVRLGRQAEALRDLEGLVGSLEPESWLAREVRRRVEDVFLRNDDQAGLAAYYEAWLKAAPDDVEAMARLGRTLVAQGRAAEARTWFDRAVKLAPARKELRLALIEQLARERKFTEAAAQYEAIVQADLNNPDLLSDWGRILLRDTARTEAERKQAAATVWNRLLESRPKDPATAAQVADLFRRAGFSEEAIALYGKAVALAPDAPQYREYLGEYYHALKRPREALETWRAIAAGPNRNARNLARLSEVLAAYGYKDEAIAAIEQASAVDADSFEFRLKHADLLIGTQRFEAALAPLGAAETLAADDDQREAVLARQITADQSAGRLPARLSALQKELEDPRAGDAAAWRRLARYHEAARQANEAITAIEKAIALDEAAVTSWAAAARLYETAGRFGDAVRVNRRLATLDRRARTQYLTSVARLETRLGRREEALQAGRDLLAAAPGNPEHIQFFAELCFQLGADAEGLETLRRAVRGNENDTEALRRLAEALAREFRTEEAIELFWRAFDRTRDLEGKLATVSRLTDLSLQRNQLDRLFERLKRIQGEPGREREGTFILAQAHATGGDFGTARAVLLELLAAAPRDTALLKQLSELAESEGDLAAAIQYQKRLDDVAPDDFVAYRLVQLALRAGEVETAEAVWARYAEGDQDHARVLQAMDSLLNHGRYDAVLATSGRLIRKDPGDWEALYREGRALMQLDRPDEAAQRFRALLDLRRDDDDVSAILKARRRTKLPAAYPSAGRAAGIGAAPVEEGLLARVDTAAFYVRAIGGLLPGAPVGRAADWSPMDFGQARMVALASLLTFAQREKTEGAFWDRLRQTPDERRRLWDTFYLGLIRLEPREVYESSRALARIAGNDPSAGYAFLYGLCLRNEPTGTPGVRQMEDDELEKAAPLPPDEIGLLRDGFIAVARTHPAWLQPAVIDILLAELRRAGRSEALEPFYRELVAGANDLDTMGVAGAIAAERGDFDALWLLYEAFNRTPLATRAAGVHQGVSVATPQGAVPTPPYWMATAMRVVANAKGHADILRQLDRVLDFARSAAQTDLRAKAARAAPPLLDQFGGAVPYMAFTVKHPRSRRLIDYPTPGRDFDYGTILLLYNAFALFQRDDLLTDLLAHARQRAEAPANDPAATRQGRLVLSALLWWKNERDEAVRLLEQVVRSAPGDVDLKLTLAALRAQRREPDEALALVDSVDAADQDATRRRELLALQLAVQTGGVERARQAAERLFGLRLDNALQIQLAAQMHQLGMHELAEAVLARARRRAGNDTEALVGLMALHQRQGNADIAAQIAHQIIRRTQGPASARANPTDAQAYRQSIQAIQVLARSGKLGAIIARLETQLRESPQSFPLRQSLAVYYQAAGAREKARANTEAMVQLRPDNAQLRATLASQLAREGNTAAALEHYRALLKTDPRVLSAFSTEIESAFRQQNKIQELVALIEQTDVKGTFPMAYLTLANSLMQEPATVDAGMRLVRTVWKAAAPQHLAVLDRLAENDAFWKQPDAYPYARAALLPASPSPRVSSWHGLDVRISSTLNGDARIHTTAGRLLETAERQGKLDELAADLEQAIDLQPHWLAGKVLLASLRVRQDRADLGRGLLDDVLSGLSRSLELTEYSALVTVGQELRDDPRGEPLAIAVYERMFKQARGVWAYTGASFPNTPVHHLARLYVRAGRVADARELLLRGAAAQRGLTTLMRDPGTPGLAYRRLGHLNGCAAFLLEIGDPADAMRVYSDVLGGSEEIQLARSNPGLDVTGLLRDARAGIERAMNGLTPEALATSLRSLTTPVTTGEGAGKVTEPEPLDLVLTIYPGALDQAALISLYSRALEPAAHDPKALAEVRAAVDAFVNRRPGDLGARVAAALVDCAAGEAKAVAEAAGRLERLVAETPLETIPEGTRPNARQRAEAAPRMALWLIARACAQHPSTRAAGDRLAALALEAARRQLDNTWALAMLREWGQQAEDQGDRPLAEARWGAMSELVLSSLAAVPPVAPADRPRLPAGRPALRAAAGDGTPVATPERFEQAADVARLAARHALWDLSLRTVRGVLRGGPPLVAFTPRADSLPRVRAAAAAQVAQSDLSDTQGIVVRLAELDGLWRGGGASASSVYEALRDVVLPTARPGEVFLYSAPLASVDKAPASIRTIPPRPQNAGTLLARWAVAAGRSDDLRKRLAERQSRAAAELPALVLLSLLAQAEGKPEADATLLEAIGRKLEKETVQNSAVLACHAALPALETGPVAPARAAVAVIERAVQILSTGTDEEPVDSLLVTLARFDFERGGPDAGRKRIEQALAVAEHAASRTAGDDPLYRRKRTYAAAAGEFLRAGLPVPALDLLAQFADAPPARGGDPAASDVLVALAGRAGDWLALEGYERLKAWSLPGAGRSTVRLLACFIPESLPGGPFREVADTPSLLIAAARDAGRLDELSRELEALDRQGVENARALRVLVEAARGRDETVLPLVQVLSAELRGRTSGRMPASGSVSLLATTGSMPPAWPDILVARACLARPALRAVGEAMAGSLAAQAERAQATEFQERLLRAFASARPPTP